MERKGLTSLLDELQRTDPETFAKVDKSNPNRVIRALEVFRASGKRISSFRKGRKQKKHPFTWIKIGLTDDREKLYQRIDQRVLNMLEDSLIEEVQKLLNMGYQPDSQALQSIGYREVIAYLEGQIDRAECIRLIQRNSRRYAKRQLTWFRKYKDIHWFVPNEIPQILNWVISKQTKT